MKNRTLAPLLAPALCIAIALAACTATRVAALCWLTAGAAAIGYRSLDSFPSLGLGPAWRTGQKSALVWLYHLAYWPRYLESKSPRDQH